MGLKNHSVLSETLQGSWIIKKQSSFKTKDWRILSWWPHCHSVVAIAFSWVEVEDKDDTGSLEGDDFVSFVLGGNNALQIRKRHDTDFNLFSQPTNQSILLELTFLTHSFFGLNKRSKDSFRIPPKLGWDTEIHKRSALRRTKSRLCSFLTARIYNSTIFLWSKFLITCD